MPSPISACRMEECVVVKALRGLLHVCYRLSPRWGVGRGVCLLQDKAHKLYVFLPSSSVPTRSWEQQFPEIEGKIA